MSESASSTRVIKDLTAGTVGGITQVLVGQPFDIVKVRLQSSDVPSTMLQTATRIVRDEGPLAFYKGTAMPLVGIGACVSIQFAVLEAAKRFFKDQNLKAGRVADKLSLGQLYLAGAAAGVGNSIVSGPVEHIRIRLQTQTGTAKGLKYYTGPVDALKKIHAADGLRGVYQGQVATLLREFHGYGMYFLAYEYLVQRQCEKQKCLRTEIGNTNAILYGAAAGYAMWLTNYPLDVIKSRIQTDGFPSDRASGGRKYEGVVDCVKKLWKAGGVTAFTRGLAPTLIRAAPVNGATFAAFEMTMRMLG